MKATESGKHLRKISQQENNSNNKKQKALLLERTNKLICAWDSRCYYSPLSVAAACSSNTRVTRATTSAVPNAAKTIASALTNPASFKLYLQAPSSTNWQPTYAYRQLECAQAPLPPSHLSHRHSLLFLISLGKPISILLVLITIEINKFCIRNT